MDSLSDKRVKIVIGDAYVYLIENRKKFDVIIADFPDPHDETITKLYTVEFFRLVRRTLNDDGIFVTQSTSPLYATEAFWCIHNTLKRVFKMVSPYHVYIPSFGDWGFNLASKTSYVMNDIDVCVDDLKFFSRDTFLNSLHFPEDLKVSSTNINTFNKPILYSYYIKGWKNYADF